MPFRTPESRKPQTTRLPVKRIIPLTEDNKPGWLNIDYIVFAVVMQDPTGRPQSIQVHMLTGDVFDAAFGTVAYQQVEKTLRQLELPVVT